MKVPCAHFDNGDCRIGKYPRPVASICMGPCNKYEGPERTDALRIAVLPAKGAGDYLSKGIVAITGGKVQPCGGCKKINAGLNRIFPMNQTTDTART